MKVGEIYGTGKAVTLSKDNYYIDGELTNISKLREYDKAGILQWDSSELRELALGLDTPTQPLSNVVFCEECGTKQLGDAKFCEECGEAVALTDKSSNPADSSVVKRGTYLLARFIYSLKESKKRAVLLGIGALTIVAIVVAVSYFQEQAEIRAAEQELAATIAVLEELARAEEEARRIELQRVSAALAQYNQYTQWERHLLAVRDFGAYRAYAGWVADFPEVLLITIQSATINNAVLQATFDTTAPNRAGNGLLEERVGNISDLSGNLFPLVIDSQGMLWLCEWGND